MLRRFALLVSITAITSGPAEARGRVVVDPRRGDGYDFLARGKPAYARTAFRNQLRKRPEDPQLLVGLGMAEFALGELDRSTESLLAGLQVAPDHAAGRRTLAEVLCARARRRMALGQHDEPTRLLLFDAADQARRSIDADPEPAEAWVVLAHAYFELGELDRAGEAILELERRGSASETLRQVRDEYASERVLAQLADGLIELPAAISRIEELRRSSPQSVELRLRLGDLYHGAQRWAEALDAYASALELDPFHRPCLELLLTYLPFDELRPRTAEILRDTDRVARRKAAADNDPRSGFARSCVGQVLLLEREWDAAAEAFASALEVDPSLSLSCGVGLADASFRRQEHDAARDTYIELARAGRDDLATRVRHLGQARLVTSNLQFLANREVVAERLANARDLLGAAALMSPTEARIWNDYAFFCRETSEYEAAGEAYLRLIELSPSDPRALNDTGLVLHYHLGRVDEARALYTRAIEAALTIEADSRAAAPAKETARKARVDAQNNLRELDAKKEASPLLSPC